jgi:integrase
MAQFIHRNGAWLVRISVSRDRATGRRRYHNHTVHGTKKDAQRYGTAFQRRLDLGEVVEPTRKTVDEFLDEWLLSAAGRLRERTKYEYERLLERYVRPKLGDVRLPDVTPLQIQSVYAGILKRNLSGRTVRYTHAVLSSALKQAVRWRMIATNPASAVDLPRVRRNEMHALSPEQAQHFLAAAEGNRMEAMFNVLLLGGLRPGEAYGLKWTDIDFDAKAVTIQRALSRTKSKWRLEEPKTAKSRRTVPLPPKVMDLLREHRKTQKEHRLASQSPYTDHGLVFATRTGQPLDAQNVNFQYLKGVLTKAGLPATIRLYDLRHTCATLLLAAGENPKVVSERLGHASVVLTLDVYSHVLPTMQQSATDRLDSLLFRKATA